MKSLHAKIGELTLDLPITKQAQVLRISSGSVCYLTCSMPETDLAIMRRLDRLNLEFPFAGSRMLQGLLVVEGCKLGRRHVKTLMQRMGIEALSPSAHNEARARPQDLPISAARCSDHATEPGLGAMDITYIAIARGLVYLAVVLDWFSRRVLSWRLSITMEAAFCVETLEDALACHGKPEQPNPGRGSTYRRGKTSDNRGHLRRQESF